MQLRAFAVIGWKAQLWLVSLSCVRIKSLHNWMKGITLGFLATVIWFIFIFMKQNAILTFLLWTGKKKGYWFTVHYEVEDEKLCISYYFFLLHCDWLETNFHLPIGIELKANLFSRSVPLDRKQAFDLLNVIRWKTNISPPFLALQDLTE